MILGEESITLRRYTGARGTDGYTDATVASTSTIRASVQPAGGSDLATLSEGERTRVAIKLYTTTELSATSPADRVTVDGVAYEVRHVERQRAVIRHFKAIAVKVDEATL